MEELLPDPARVWVHTGPEHEGSVDVLYRELVELPVGLVGCRNEDPMYNVFTPTQSADSANVVIALQGRTKRLLQCPLSRNGRMQHGSI